MQYFLLILSIFGIHFSAWLTPGPTFLLLFRNALMYGWGSIIWNALGVFASNIIHTSYAILVLTMITGFVTGSLSWIQILGSVYFIYLGVKTVIGMRHLEFGPEKRDHQTFRAFELFREAFLTNLLSPKATLFFLSIFSVVIEKDSPTWVLVILWIGLPVNSFVLANAVGYIVSRSGVRKVYAKYSREISISLGIVMILLGLSLFFSR